MFVQNWKRFSEGAKLGTYDGTEVVVLAWRAGGTRYLIRTELGTLDVHYTRVVNLH